MMELGGKPVVAVAMKLALPVLPLLAWILAAQPSRSVEMDWQVIDHPGNAADSEVMKCCFDLTGTTGFGRVRYVYRIGRNKVTVAQYTEFLNAVAASDPNGLWVTRMDAEGDGTVDRFGSDGSYTYQVRAGTASWPMPFVDPYRAFRFANWMHNGQPSGPQDASTTEDGAYTLLGGNPPAVERNARATVFVPSEDEWYKAAYYDPVLEVYYDWPTGTDDLPVPGPPPGGTNSCNYVLPPRSCPDATEGICSLTDVGAYVDSPSAFGTYGQCGDLIEITDTPAISPGQVVIRGTAWNFNALDAKSEFRNDITLFCMSCPFTGFRVASTLPGPPPECGDGIDNDGDGSVDWPGDRGCEFFGDPGERTPIWPCDDGIDNDGDGMVDFDPDVGEGDPGCLLSVWIEDPQCQDGIDNDFRAGTDWDGGESVLGLGNGDPNGPDPDCAQPYQNREATSGCGLGVELVLLVPILQVSRRLYRRSGGR